MQQLDLHRRLNSQLSIIDRLTNDKSELTRQVEMCASEITRLKEKSALDAKIASDEAARNVDRAKKIASVQERAKREAWEKEKEEEIKERTVRALEPQIDAIIAEQRSQRRRLELQFNEEKDMLTRKFSEDLQLGIRKAREEALMAAESEISAARSSFLENGRHEFELLREQLDEERKIHLKSLETERVKFQNDLNTCKDSHSKELAHLRQILSSQSDARVTNLEEVVTSLNKEKQIVVETFEKAKEDAMREKVIEVRAFLEKDFNQKMFQLQTQHEDKHKSALKEISEKMAVEVQRRVNLARAEVRRDGDQENLQLHSKIESLVNALSITKQDIKSYETKQIELENTVSVLEIELMETKNCFDNATQRNSDLEQCIRSMELNLSSMRTEGDCELQMVRSRLEAEFATEKLNLEKRIEELETSLSRSRVNLESAQEALRAAEERKEKIMRETAEQIKSNDESCKRAINVAEAKIVHMQALLDRQRQELLGKLR